MNLVRTCRTFAEAVFFNAICITNKKDEKGVDIPDTVNIGASAYNFKFTYDYLRNGLVEANSNLSGSIIFNPSAPDFHERMRFREAIKLQVALHPSDKKFARRMFYLHPYGVCQSMSQEMLSNREFIEKLFDLLDGHNEREERLLDVMEYIIPKINGDLRNDPEFLLWFFYLWNVNNNFYNLRGYDLEIFDIADQRELNEEEIAALEALKGLSWWLPLDDDYNELNYEFMRAFDALPIHVKTSVMFLKAVIELMVRNVETHEWHVDSAYFSRLSIPIWAAWQQGSRRKPKQFDIV